MNRDEYIEEHTNKKMDATLMPGWNEQQGLPPTNADRQALRDELLDARPMIDANSFEDVENEKLCQFCVHFSDKKNYLGQLVHFCAKNKISVNSGTKCFNGKFKRV